MVISPLKDQEKACCLDFDSWLLLASIALVACLTPGPAVLLVTTHSVKFGTKHSIATMLGNIPGLFFMSLFSVLGLSAIILHSAPIFITVKLVGACYLIFLGVKLWRKGLGLNATRTAGKSMVARRPNNMKLYIYGLLVALTNPKAIAFTTALFPQFVQPDRAIVSQFTILILTFMFLSLLCLLGFGVMAERAKTGSEWIKVPGFMDKEFGGAFIGSGVFLVCATQE